MSGYYWNVFMGGILGTGGTSIGKSYNTGNINCSGGSTSGYLYIGGVSGNSSGTIKECYNEGNINNASIFDYVYMGGITGSSNQSISDGYNAGQITNTQNNAGYKETCYVGGIVGNTYGPIVNCYDVGSVYSGMSNVSADSIEHTYSTFIEKCSVGPIYGERSGYNPGICKNNFYNEDIDVEYPDASNGQNSNNNLEYCTACKEKDMRTEDFCNELKSGSSGCWLYLDGQYPTLDIGSVSTDNGATERVVNNKKKKFDITTEVGKDASGSATGGTISGEYIEPYLQSNGIQLAETVGYGESNKEEIKITPSSNYMIQRVTLNGKEIEFSTDDEGNCTIPANHFKNITENYHIVAYFIQKKNVLTINKKDDEENKIAGAVFKIESEGLTQQDILGDLHKNGTYEFTKGEDGKITPNNKGLLGTIAKSYYIIDLRGREDKIKVKVTAQNDSSNKLYGIITDSKEAPEYSEESTFMDVSSTDESEQIDESYETEVLEGGKVYYLHFGYICSSAETSTTGPEISNIQLVNEDDTEKEDMFMVRETNANGQIVLQVPKGDYEITEIQAPEGYELNDTTQKCEVGGEEDSGNCVVDVKNTKLKEVVIHYYLKENTSELSQANSIEDTKSAEQNSKSSISNTVTSKVNEIINKSTESKESQPISLKEDVHLYGATGDEYDTAEYVELQLQGYTLEVDENNNYVIPDNATGEFGQDVIHVNYYYEKKSSKLTSISINKKWNLPEDLVDDYRATIRLVKVENNRLIPVYDSNGDEITREIRGNGTAIIENLLQFNEDGTEIEYMVQEVKVEKVKSINEETQEEIWEELPLEQFKATYNVREKE